MARSTNKVVPEAKAALEKFKYEVASDMCVKNIFKHYYLLATLLNPPSLRDTSLPQGRQVFSFFKSSVRLRLPLSFLKGGKFLAFSNPPSLRDTSFK